MIAVVALFDVLYYYSLTTVQLLTNYCISVNATLNFDVSVYIKSS